jgi:drug/metabolite transporter (DMT)-like permease
VLVFGSAVSYAVYLAVSGEAVERLGALRLVGLASTLAYVLCIGQFFMLRSPSIGDSNALFNPDRPWVDPTPPHGPGLAHPSTA